MTYKEKIEKLDTTVKKRLGIRANEIWDELKRGLFLVDEIKKHITNITVPRVEKVEENGDLRMTINYDFYRKKMDEEVIRQIELWLLENIDKERLKEWLDK